MIDFKNVRIPYSVLPTYPPYHIGSYIEEFVYEYYLKNKKTFDDTGYTLLPIFWTTAYWYNKNLEPYINALPKENKYFCVAQHDDGVKEKLPPDTLVFSAGGNYGGIPIPLVCSPINTEQHLIEKDILCSFVGSLTHPVRELMVNSLKHDSDFYINCKDWKFQISNDDQNDFLNTLSRSEFALCPRGYGLQSFRFYEALQLGTIPIYIHDDNVWKPYTDELDWNEFSISIHIKHIDNLKNIISNISFDKKTEMRTKGLQAYNDVFALKHVPSKVLKHLQMLNKL